MNVDQHNAIAMPSPHYFPARYGHKPLFIILHGTAGGSTAQGIGAYFQGTVQSASHYVIGGDGTIVQCVEEKDGAWANGGISGEPGKIGGWIGDGIHHDPWWTETYVEHGQPVNPNLITISIEHVKSAEDNSSVLTPLQEQASFKLVHDICQRWNIPMRAADAHGGITGHFSMDPVNRSHCPGPYPFDRLFSYLGANSMIDIHVPSVADHFEEVNATMWKCKQNGKTIKDGILNYYKTCGGQLGGYGAYRLPITDEFYPRPGVSIQRFECGVLCYDPHHVIDHPEGFGDVYPLKIYEGIGLDPRLDTALKQLGASNSNLATAEANIKTLQGELSHQQQPDPDFLDARKTLEDALPALQQLEALVQKWDIADKATIAVPAVALPQPLSVESEKNVPQAASDVTEVETTV